VIEPNLVCNKCGGEVSCSIGYFGITGKQGYRIYVVCSECDLIASLRVEFPDWLMTKPAYELAHLKK